MKITITADGRKLAATTNGQPLTSGSVGIEAAFVLSADYDGLAVTAVFSAGKTQIDVVLTNPNCIVPWEVLQEAKTTLFVGVVGKNGSGEIVIPTVWGRVGVIECGTVAEGLDPQDPTPDIAAQILQQARAALEEAEETKEAAAQSAESAAGSAANAAGSATDAAAAKTAAETAQAAAETAQSAAAASASSAAGSASTAAQQAQAAGSAKAAAEAAQEAAEVAKNYAQTFTGAPRAAGSAAQMTDTSLIYVYTGTTSGALTNGHWYYWDGSAWADGGVYNSTAVETDTTLTVSGAPADAKTTGDEVGDLKRALANHVDYLSNGAAVTHFNSSYFQNGTISTSDGTNVYSSKHIRTTALLSTNDAFTIAVPTTIKGIVYYYSEMNLNSYTGYKEIPENGIIAIPAGTFYRFVFYYADETTPDIGDIVGKVNVLTFENKDITNLQSITSKKYDKDFQLGTISTEDGQNVYSAKYIRTVALWEALENFSILLPQNIGGTIYYYSEMNLNSYTSYAEITPQVYTHVKKGSYYRLVLHYADLSTPDISDIVNSIIITYNIINRIDRIDANTQEDKWTTGGIDVDTGGSNYTNTRIRTDGFIQPSSYSIVAVGSYGVSVYIWNASTYIGCLNPGGVVSKTNIHWYKNIDLNDLADLHPEYRYKLVACRLDSSGNPLSDTMSPSAEKQYIKLFTQFEKKLFDEKTFCPLVSFIDDDAPIEAFENWRELGEATGIRCGFAVPTGSMTSEQWAAIERAYSAGFDILSHTHNHINLMNETDQSVVNADLQASVEILHEHGVNVKALVYPQSSISQDSLATLKKYFEYSFNGENGEQSIQGNPVRQHNITRTNTVEQTWSTYTDPDDGVTYDVHDMLPLSTLKSYVDIAVEKNCWIIFETHFRNSRTAFPGNDGLYYSPEMKHRTIDLIRYAIDKGCKVVTPFEGYNIIKNRFARGTYGGGSYYIVDRNGFVYRKNM